MSIVQTTSRIRTRTSLYRLVTTRREPHTLLTSSTSIDQERDHRIDLALYGPLLAGEPIDVKFAVGHDGRWTGMILTVEDSGSALGDDFRLDVKKNGTSIFSENADKPTVPAGSSTTQTDQTDQVDIHTQTFEDTDVFQAIIDTAATDAEHASLTLFYHETEGVLPTTHHRIDYSYYGTIVAGEAMGTKCAIGKQGIITGALLTVENSGDALGDDFVVDILKNDVSVFSSLPNKPTIAAGESTTQVDQTAAADFQTTTFLATDIFSFPILSVSDNAENAKLTLFYNEV